MRQKERHNTNGKTRSANVQGEVWRAKDKSDDVEVKENVQGGRTELKRRI
jgi:hypothetical protein